MFITKQVRSIHPGIIVHTIASAIGATSLGTLAGQETPARVAPWCAKEFVLMPILGAAMVHSVGTGGRLEGSIDIDQLGIGSIITGFPHGGQFASVAISHSGNQFVHLILLFFRYLQPSVQDTDLYKIK
jgi:hypothetical protein